MDREDGVGRDGRGDLDAEELAHVPGGARRDALGKAYAPGLIGRSAVVVAHEETADAAERVRRGERGRAELGRPADGNAEAPAVEYDGERAADEPAVPHHSSSAEERAEVLGEHDVPELCADDAADDRRDDHVARVVLAHPELADLPPGEPPPDQETDHQHDAVAGDLERTEVDDERIDGHGISRSARVSPGKGRSSRGSRSSPLRSPRRSRHPPAAPIMAALSVLSRGEAT